MQAWDETYYTTEPHPWYTASSFSSLTFPGHHYLIIPCLKTSSNLAFWLCPPTLWPSLSSVPIWKHCSPHRVQGAWTFTPQYPLLIKIPGFLRMCHAEPHKCSLQTPLLSLSMLISGMNTRPEFFSSRLKVPLKVLGSGLTRHSNFQCLFCLCLSFESTVYPSQQSQSDVLPAALPSHLLTMSLSWPAHSWLVSFK